MSVTFPSDLRWQLDGYGFGFRVQFDAVITQLTTVAGLFEAAKWSRWHDVIVAVDPVR